MLLAEIQQTSDVTYRIYDYNRVDKATGETRELHNDLALDVIDFSVHDSYKTIYNNKDTIGLHEPIIDQKDISSVVKVLKSGYVSTAGNAVSEFESLEKKGHV